MGVDLAAALREVGIRTGDAVALAAGDAVTVAVPSACWHLSVEQAAGALQDADDDLRPRWVWWRARETLGPLLRRVDTSQRRTGEGALDHRTLPRLRACWDLAAVHRLVAGGWRDDPALVWASAGGLAAAGIPATGQLELLGIRTGSDDDGSDDDGFDDDGFDDDGFDNDRFDDDGDAAEPVRPDGYLRPDWAGGAWRRDPDRRERWARLALVVQARQAQLLSQLRCAGDGGLTARSESAAAVLGVELGFDGLPIDRVTAQQLLGRLVGPRPASEAEARQSRAERDNRVLRLAPAIAGETDLRNPAQVRAMLAGAGIDVPDTRSWRLERFADAHPVVPALLSWRKSERIATTYGYDWLDRHVAPDGRLRGEWTASDGGAGRMTAQTGLHNLPAEMRVAVAAEAGHLLVRADLGQVEPRVLAAVSGDAALAKAALEDDLYLPVAARIGCSRAVAKVAVLAAMYGQTSGAAGQALAGMKRSYPVAIDFLDRADAAGRAGRAVVTYGGRHVSAGPVQRPGPEGTGGEAQRSAAAARGRYLRNAVIQGAAAELFKAWAATVRADLLDSGAGEIVLCLHDELLLQVRAAEADRVAASLVPALERTAARWFRGAAPVRFVASVVVVPRWSDAKG